MAVHRDRHFLAIGSDVRLMLTGLGLLLAVGLASGVGVGLVSSRQLARTPDMAVRTAAVSPSLSDSVQDAWSRLRDIAQLDWRVLTEPARALAERGTGRLGGEAAPAQTARNSIADDAAPIVAPE